MASKFSVAGKHEAVKSLNGEGRCEVAVRSVFNYHPKMETPSAHLQPRVERLICGCVCVFIEGIFFVALPVVDFFYSLAVSVSVLFCTFLLLRADGQIRRKFYERY